MLVYLDPLCVLINILGYQAPAEEKIVVLFNDYHVNLWNS